MPQYREIHETVETQFPGATERERFHEALRQLVDRLVSGLIEGTVAAAEASGAADFEDVRAYPARLARLLPSRRRPAAHSSGSCSPGCTLRMPWARTGSCRWSGSASCSASSWRIPTACRSRMRKQALDEPAHRVVCDYIAGMTDGFFHRTYEQMLGFGR